MLKYKNCEKCEHSIPHALTSNFCRCTYLKCNELPINIVTGEELEENSEYAYCVNLRQDESLCGSKARYFKKSKTEKFLFSMRNRSLLIQA